MITHISKILFIGYMFYMVQASNRIITITCLKNKLMVIFPFQYQKTQSFLKELKDKKDVFSIVTAAL